MGVTLALEVPVPGLPLIFVPLSWGDIYHHGISFFKIYACVLVTQSCLTLCDSMDCNLLGSSVHGILPAKILDRVAISFSEGSSQPKDRTCVSCLEGRFFTAEPTGKPL